MTTITDFTNELHIRLYVAELLKENVKDKDFDEQAEKMLAFITKKANLPERPRVPDASLDMQVDWNNIPAYPRGK